MNKKTRVFSPEQTEIIQSFGQGMAILAGAGSGKTTTLVAKCGRLLELNPQAKMIAVSFTERSTRDLRDQLSQLFCDMGKPELFHQQWILTIHGLCGSIIKEFPREAGLDGEESVLSETEAERLWEKALESIWREQIPPFIETHVRNLIERESLESISDLMTRVRDLSSFGIFSHFEDSEEGGIQSLREVAKFILEKYRLLKWKQGAIDFNDLELGAKKALSFQHVRDSYHRRFDLVLVDEFQDTNPLQAELIEKLARFGLTNLCVVGDPKQSIYRFRDADVQVFEEFCRRLPCQFSLTWNFRSLPGIIDWMNPLCQKLFQASDMRFDPLVPMRLDDQSLKMKGSSVVRLNVSESSGLATWIKEQISQGFSLKDFVLLVRRIRGNEKWFKGLRMAGIPLSVGSGGLFWEDPRVRELLSLLRWIDSPENSFSGGVFLRAPWMEIPDTVLNAWIKEDPTWKKPFFSSKHPVAEALKVCLQDASGSRTQVRPGEVLLALCGASYEIELELGSPLLGLWHRLEELSSRGFDFHSAVEEVSLASEKKRREREVPMPENIEHLSVLTLHGAKGLEFPQVILIDFEEKSRVSDSPLLFWDRQSGVHLERRDQSGSRLKDGVKDLEWRDREKKKSLAESKRLFYVALTRARDRLILVCPKKQELFLRETKGGMTSPKDAYLYEDHWHAWVEAGPDLECIEPSQVNSSDSLLPQKTVPKIYQKNDLQEKANRQVRARHSVTEWTLLYRCPRSYEWTFIRPVQVKNRVIEKQSSIQENSKLLGTLVHKSLETGDLSALQELSDLNSQAVGNSLVQWVKSSPYMAESDPAKDRKVWKELAFEVPVGEEILVGTMDRLIRVQDQNSIRYQIIDFKMSEKKGSGTTFIRSYEAQMNLYAFALSKLEPLSKQNTEAHLIQIFLHPDAVPPRNLRVPLGSVDALKLASLADEIINGKPGEPRLGPYCKTCHFRFQCDAYLEHKVEKTTPLQFDLGL